MASAPSQKTKKNRELANDPVASSGGAGLKSEMLTFVPILKETEHSQVLLLMDVRSQLDCEGGRWHVIPTGS